MPPHMNPKTPPGFSKICHSVFQFFRHFQTRIRRLHVLLRELLQKQRGWPKQVSHRRSSDVRRFRSALGTSVHGFPPARMVRRIAEPTASEGSKTTNGGATEFGRILEVWPGQTSRAMKTTWKRNFQFFSKTVKLSKVRTCPYYFQYVVVHHLYTVPFTLDCIKTRKFAASPQISSFW